MALRDDSRQAASPGKSGSALGLRAMKLRIGAPECGPGGPHDSRSGDRRYFTSPEGGRSAGAEAHSLFGLGPMRKCSSPPATIWACVIQERFHSLPLSSALWM